MFNEFMVMEYLPPEVRANPERHYFETESAAEQKALELGQGAKVYKLDPGTGGYNKISFVGKGRYIKKMDE
jgi:hypothetical protein